ncbi:acetyl-CoA carboxylase biotin carboxyl carrier protein subunit, partial [Micrococcus sp. HG099]|nr:acetyl-CoA carboxylase biotin carboxyl carrier protein subunit [Micrococcus sp. HG099]
VRSSAASDVYKRRDDAGALLSPVTGSLAAWAAEDGATVAAGQTVAVLEAMKTETPVTAPAAGILRREALAPGAGVARGQRLARIES